ncbi:MAG: ABC transporter permease [Gemmatimonadetes bacterium]|nr:ABC transporter permease [Gemmatimonadota bacterium]
MGPDPVGDVDDELSFHFEMRVREFVARGESPERARELALIRFGEYEAFRDECVAINERRRRNMARSEYLSEVRQDVSHTVRMLRRAPGFTAVVVATLALAIAANSTIFTVVRGVLLESLPFHAADRLYEVRTLYPDGMGYTLSPPDFMSIRESNGVFEQVEAYTVGTLTLLGAGVPKEIVGARVSVGLFELLGLPLALGRGFLPEEAAPGAGLVAVLDHGFWQRELGGDATVLGRTLHVAGQPYTVVGVLAPRARLSRGGGPSARFEVDIDMYAPLEQDDRFSAVTAAGRRGEFLRVFARARPGADAARVESDMRRIGSELQSAFPDTNSRLTFDATSLRDLIVGDVRTPLLVLLGAVGFVLLIACANVANLLLARSSARRGELAVRAALGAGHGRLLRHLLTEAVVLGLLGGAVGLLVAYWGTGALVRAQPADIPRLDEISVDVTVAVFTLGAALFSAMVIGVVPALQATGGRLMGALRESGRGSVGGGQRLRATLVVAETALAVVLLTGAGLLVHSFVELTRVDTGFQPEGAVALRLNMQGEAYQTGEQIRMRVEEVLARAGALPGITASAATTVLPFGGLLDILAFTVDGAPPPDFNAEIGVASVTPFYFDAIGSPLRSGRAFTSRDHADAPAVAIINEAAVRRWFAGEDPIGRRVTVGSTNLEIVGVVANVLQRDPASPVEPQLFQPYAQRASRSVRVVVRTTGDPLALAPALRAEVRALDPNLPVMDVTPLTQLVSASVGRPRFYAGLLTLFAAIGLALASIGVFGVMSYAVARRAHEISIRVALGARAGTVVRMIVSRAMVLAAIGAGIGILASLALGRVIQSQLFGVTLLDPLTLAAVVIVLSVSAAVASYLPARRAAAVDPVTALRGG